MSGISVKLPLYRSDEDGCYGLNKTLISTVQQNFKHLVLTNAGEKMMDPLFGCSLRKFLFENNVDNTHLIIAEKIREQAGKYMPFIEIKDINFRGPEVDPLVSKNFLYVSIEYKLLPLNANVVLNLVEEVK